MSSWPGFLPRVLAFIVATLAVVLSLPSDAAADPAGGRIGPYAAIIPANTTSTRTVTLRGGEVTRFTVVGDGDTDLDCEVELNDVIYHDNRASDVCVIDVDVSKGGNVSFRIKNLGDVCNSYVWSAF